jgi:hypothetical protein
MLLVEEYPPPDQGMFVALWGGQCVVVNEKEGLTEVEVISEAIEPASLMRAIRHSL